MSSLRQRAAAKAEQRELTAAALAAGCSKAAYANQAGARLALAKLIEKKPALSGLRVYPCDVCPAWHLTSKNSGKKIPPWDRNPNWTRPAG
jgi:hypothetical protein